MVILEKLAEIAKGIGKVIKVPEDKIQHAVAGGMIGAAVMCGTGLTNPELSMIVVTLVGVGKEIYDLISNKMAKKKVHDVDVFDTIATVIGGALIVGLLAALKTLL